MVLIFASVGIIVVVVRSLMMFTRPQLNIVVDLLVRSVSPEDYFGSLSIQLEMDCMF